MVNIRTNNAWRDLVSYSDLPEKAKAEFKDEFEATLIHGADTDSPNYFQYRGDWFSLDQFARISVDAIGFEYAVSSDSPLAGWSGICHGTYDSGWVVRLSRTDEHYGQIQVGYFW